MRGGDLGQFILAFAGLVVLVAIIGRLLTHPDAVKTIAGAATNLTVGETNALIGKN